MVILTMEIDYKLCVTRNTKTI